MFSFRRSLIAVALAAFTAGCNEGRHEPSEQVMQDLLLPRITEFFAPQFPKGTESDIVTEAYAAYQDLVPAYRAARVLEFRKVGCEQEGKLWRCEFSFQADTGGKLGIVSVQEKVPFVYRDGMWIAGGRHP